MDVEAAFLAALADDPDAILSDRRLPRFSGERALKLACLHVPDVPFVIVSGSIRVELAVDTLHQGADDYVLKDRPARLGPVVRRALDARQLRLERRHAAEQLAFQAEVLANLRDAVVSTDLDGFVTSWNAGASKVFGWAADEVLGRVLPFPEPLRPAVASRIVAVIDAGGPSGQVVPVQLARRDGRSIRVETRATSLVDQAGSRVGYLRVARDVTEMKAQRAERDRLAMALEQSSESIVMTDADARIV